MDRLIGLLGIVLILGIAWGFSNNRKAINYRTVGMGLLLQALLAVFILKVPLGKSIFGWLGEKVTKVLSFSDEGAKFVFGILGDDTKLAPLFGNDTFISYLYNMDTLPGCLINTMYKLRHEMLYSNFMKQFKTYN